MTFKNTDSSSLFVLTLYVFCNIICAAEFSFVAFGLERRIKYFLQGKYSSAKIHLKRLEKSVQKTKALIRSCDSTTGSVVIGYFVHWVPTIKRDLLMSLIPFVGITVVAITRLVENIKGILDSIKETREKGESISIDNFNLYKNNLMNQMDTFLKAIKKMEELADKMDKAEDVLKKELKKEEKKK